MSVFDDITSAWPAPTEDAQEALERELQHLLLGHPDAPLPQDLVAKLLDASLREPRVCDADTARLILATRGHSDALMAHLTQTLMEDDSWLRDKCAEAICQLATQRHTDALWAVIHRTWPLEGGEDGFQIEAFRRLQALGVSGLLPSVRAQFNLASADQRPRWRALWLELEDATDTQRILHALGIEQPNPYFLFSGLHAPAPPHEPELTERVLDVALDETRTPTTRTRALHMLRMLQDPSVVPVLQERLRVTPMLRDHMGREALYLYLQLDAPGAATLLLEAHEHDFDLTDCWWLMEALLHGSGTDTERARFRRALERRLQESLEDRQPRANPLWRVFESLPYLAQLYPEDDAVLALCLALCPETTPLFARRNALEALTHMRHPEASPTLLTWFARGDAPGFLPGWTGVEDASWIPALAAHLGQPEDWRDASHRNAQGPRLRRLVELDPGNFALYLLEVVRAYAGHSYHPWFETVCLLPSLRSLGETGRESLRTLLTMRDAPRDRAPILGALVALQDPSATDELLRLLGRLPGIGGSVIDTETWAAVTLALAGTGHPAALPHLHMLRASEHISAFDWRRPSIAMLAHYLDDPDVPPLLERLTQGFSLWERPTAREALAGQRPWFPHRWYTGLMMEGP